MGANHDVDPLVNRSRLMPITRVRAETESRVIWVWCGCGSRLGYYTQLAEEELVLLLPAVHKARWEANIEPRRSKLSGWSTGNASCNFESRARTALAKPDAELPQAVTQAGAGGDRNYYEVVNIMIKNLVFCTGHRQRKNSKITSRNVFPPARSSLGEAVQCGIGCPLQQNAQHG